MLQCYLLIHREPMIAETSEVKTCSRQLSEDRRLLGCGWGWGGRGRSGRTAPLICLLFFAGWVLPRRSWLGKYEVKNRASQWGRPEIYESRKKQSRREHVSMCWQSAPNVSLCGSSRKPGGSGGGMSNLGATIFPVCLDFFSDPDFNLVGRANDGGRKPMGFVGGSSQCLSF